MKGKKKAEKDLIRNDFFCRKFSDKSKVKKLQQDENWINPQFVVLFFVSVQTRLFIITEILFPLLCTRHKKGITNHEICKFKRERDLKEEKNL